MSTETRTLVTIVTEAVLEHAVCDDLERLGARGYTVVNARGAGSRGVRTADWSTGSNVRIEVVCEREVAERIETYLHDRYYENYAMVVWAGEVRVLRPGKF